jgi:hypothetical protein
MYACMYLIMDEMQQNPHLANLERILSFNKKSKSISFVGTEGDRLTCFEV